jgi:hypothetical protein
VYGRKTWETGRWEIILLFSCAGLLSKQFRFFI